MRNLDELEPYLKSRILGQDHVLPIVASLVRQAEMGLTHAGELKSSMLFLGPTGVGKTETALAVSEFLHGSGHFYRFDMSEFQDQNTGLVNFIGGPDGNKGRLGRILEKPGPKVLLFDEIEKAHPDILDLFLQILENAHVTIGDGIPCDLSQCHVVLTSNVGSEAIMNAKRPSFARIEEHVISAFARRFRPELMYRFQARLVFNKLSHETQLRLAELELKRELERQALKGCQIQYSEEAVLFLFKVGFHKLYGARPLRNAVRFHIRQALVDQLSSNGSGQILNLELAICGSRLAVSADSLR